MGDEITVIFPREHPNKDRPLKLQPTGQACRYSDLTNGEYFRMGAVVYEKLDDSNAAALLPWDGDGYMEMDSNGLCHAFVDRLTEATE